MALFGLLLGIVLFLWGISEAVSKIVDQQRQILAKLAELTREEA